MTNLRRFSDVGRARRRRPPGLSGWTSRRVRSRGRTGRRPAPTSRPAREAPRDRPGSHRLHPVASSCGGV